MSDASTSDNEQLPPLPDYGPTDGEHGTDDDPAATGEVDPLQKITESEREPGTPPAA
ncbi:hypothetical protein [Cryobacterium tepidiphilum]|jgi:hypothetical protein|uniref:hypothetical protein n=1 Tax=Cryobacterium tepidiphilum TaxID=2486026 RepID=UPI001314556F|nr:hypothetical protein [Cryobacterium tepidiphilum]